MLRPDVTQPLSYAWAGFLGALLVATLGLWWYSDDAGLGDKVEAAREAYQDREGSSQLLLKREVDQQRKANRELSETIEHIKEQVGIEPIDPFIVPERYAGQRRFYFNMIFEATRNTLFERAVRRRISLYESELGYEKKQLDDAEVAQELTRLQLIAKAIMLALSTEGDLASIQILHGSIEQTGPKDRPPLLVEYGFSLKVKGALKDVLWLLHQLGVEEPDEEIERGLNTLFTTVQRKTEVKVQPLGKADFFPLIVRGLDIKSSNVTPRDNISMLEVTIDLAGMEFLSEEERAQGGRAQRGGSSGNVRLPRGTGRSPRGGR